MKQKKFVSHVVYFVFIMSILAVLGFTLISCTGKDDKSKTSSLKKMQKKANPASDFKYDLTEDGKGIKIMEFLGKSVDLIIPDTIEDLPVTEIDFGYDTWSYDFSTNIPTGEKVWNDFFNKYQYIMKPFNSVVVPSSVTTVGEYAFSHINGVDIDISKLKKIGTHAFKNARLINTDITISKNVELTGLKDEAMNTYSIFDGSNITALTLEEGMSELCIGFAYCANLEKVTIPSSIKKISQYEFIECPRLSIKTRQAIKEAGYKGEF